LFVRVYVPISRVWRVRRVDVGIRAGSGRRIKTVKVKPQFKFRIFYYRDKKKQNRRDYLHRDVRIITMILYYYLCIYYSITVQHYNILGIADSIYTYINILYQ